MHNLRLSPEAKAACMLSLQPPFTAELTIIVKFLTMGNRMLLSGHREFWTRPPDYVTVFLGMTPLISQSTRSSPARFPYFILEFPLNRYFEATSRSRL
ncbi:hypothetical protein PHLCEN_2v9220 [Hermanssonia centrifuga]|uniref:Uncharacterized protein n=1 Tax=Hermanssonia centrifuga TaxID=98765 RepID=A0A2R6NRI8_9APHY|nr:hypothetical protein PHLCEN_2v9220 [Hermanssonia centrifuga]